ncbi:MAG TPA: patatin-like phospholipase family protein, partial [Halanaerobiales bacterium]|nr:patatin-like phospholipase family protein [Halanaerobiales bacterium]
SMGAVIGGIYAAGFPVKYMKELARNLEWEHITDITFPRKGLIKGEKLLKFLELITAGKNIEDLNIPFLAIACDTKTGEHIEINDGPLAQAIRASTAVPGIYIPFFHQEHLLVDGGVIDPVPASSLRKMGADIVIAVDVGGKIVNGKAENLFDILYNTFDIIQHELDKYREIDADIIITPELEGLSSFDLSQHEKCFAAGLNAAQNAFPSIKKIIEESV